MNQTIQLTKSSDGIARVTLNRPEKHNAFDDQMIVSLTQCFEDLANDDATNVVVLAANGKTFCAGGDLGHMQKMVGFSYEENFRDARVMANMFDSLNRLPQPTVARIQGNAFGGGVGLASCCDIVIAESGSNFCLSEVKIGLIPATIAPYVVDAIGLRAARRYFASAEMFNAQAAKDIGLVSEVVPPEQLDTTLEKLLKQLLKNSPNAMRQAKAMVTTVQTRERGPELMDYTSEQIARLRTSEDGQEGLKAFLEKRKPAWVTN